MTIRSATIKDLEALHAIEITCFPPNQAASLETLERRLNIFPQHFWLIEEDGKVIGFINGMITDYNTVEFSRKNNRKGITLTCEKHLIPYYEKAGFVNAGLSASVHGGDVFYDMQKVL